MEAHVWLRWSRFLKDNSFIHGAGLAINTSINVTPDLVEDFPELFRLSMVDEPRAIILARCMILNFALDSSLNDAERDPT